MAGSRWPGIVFGGIGFVMFAVGLGLLVDRLVIYYTWPEIEARVVESRVEPKGSQHSAIIRVQFEVGGRAITSEPASDFRSNNYGWVAEAVDRHPVGGTTTVRHHPREPQRTRLDVGFNFNTFGTALLLIPIGLLFKGVGFLADRHAQLERAESSAATEAEKASLKRGQYLGMAVFIGIIALVFLGPGIFLLRPALDERGWPTIAGTVEKTDIFTRTSNSRKHGPTTFYVGRVYVSYAFGERTYHSALDLSDSSTDRAKVERRLEGIKPGGLWNVRVNPADPYTIKSTDSWPLLLPGVFLFVGLVVGFVTWLIVRSAPRPKRA